MPKIARRSAHDASFAAAPNLAFSGLQAYHGSAQHLRTFAERRDAIAKAVAMTRDTVAQLDMAGLQCAIVGGAGTGTYEFEGMSGVYNELQCGSYVFMDADYGRIRDANGAPLSTFANALFILTTIDTGTRVGRFLVQEFLGGFYPPLGRKDWMPGAVGSTLVIVASWSYFIWNGSINTIWPMFGIANQLLAAVALAVATTGQWVGVRLPSVPEIKASSLNWR